MLRRDTPRPARGLFFDSAGVRIHYEVEGSGEPVVLIHGYISDLRKAWVQRGVIGKLAERWRVAALDCRGHGKSDKPTDPAAYGREMAWDVVRLLDHLDVGAAHLVGYSMGAHMIAQLLTLVSERILTATMAGSAGRWGWTAADDELAELEARELEAGSLRSQILRLTPAGSPIPSDAEIQSRSRAALRGQDLGALAAVRRANRNEVVTEEQLARANVPVLGVVGSLDPFVPRFRHLAKLMPDFQLVVVEGGTHRTTAGHPTFVRAVEDFLAAHPTTWKTSTEP
jgi:pimeloyl-ACP methyl ester carboxylesterase